MDINNIALVRATNVIPFQGVIKPISNVPYLTKNIGLEFSARISDLLREVGIIPSIDPEKMFDDGYYDEMVALSSNILKNYLPYTSDYNSMVLFSLNGLCPDDNEHGFGNNTFSNKKCAIIEPLKYHIDEAISLVPTDTAIKGDIYLSDEAIILINEEVLERFSAEQKDKLLSLNLTIKPFQGELKEAVYETLEKTGRYTPERLSLSANTGGIMPSKTSEQHKKLINEIANTYGLSQQKYFNLITSNNAEVPKYVEVCDEYKKMIFIQDYFMSNFLYSLLTVLNASKDIKRIISSNLYNKSFILHIIDLIKSYGIENYKTFVDKYNKELESQLLNGTLPTPNEIIDLNKSKKI